MCTENRKRYPCALRTDGGIRVNREQIEVSGYTENRYLITVHRTDRDIIVNRTDKDIRVHGEQRLVSGTLSTNRGIRVH